MVNTGRNEIEFSRLSRIVNFEPWLDYSQVSAKLDFVCLLLSKTMSMQSHLKTGLVSCLVSIGNCQEILACAVKRIARRSSAGKDLAMNHLLDDVHYYRKGKTDKSSLDF